MRPNPGLRHPALGGIASPAKRHDSWRKRMQRASSENPGESAGALLALSNDLAGAVERAGRAVVAIYARPRVPSSGILWRPDVVVAADHTIKRDEEITLSLRQGRPVPAFWGDHAPSTALSALNLHDA